MDRELKNLSLQPPRDVAIISLSTFTKHDGPEFGANQEMEHR